MPFFFTFFQQVLHRCFNVPDESAYTDFLVAEIQFLDRLEERRRLFVFDDGDHAGVHLRPCVGATTGFTAVGATTLDLLEEREATDAEHVQHVFYSTRVRLIEHYHD